MMLFKLSMRNMKKSFKDYMIYFLTIFLGVAVFYIFNSIDSQKAMMDLSNSASELIDFLMDMLSGVSVFVSMILGFLLVYANNFLIRRRKKEFGIYMTLGMSKSSISKMLFLETLCVGIISLSIGLIVGIFASQLTSVLLVRMFRANLTDYTFVFSSSACIKTIIYFGVMYVLIMLFNVRTISKYQLIDLIKASHQNEQVKMRNPLLSVILFIISIIILSYAYYKVTIDFSNIRLNSLGMYILMGVFATFLFFYSLSGFVLKLVQQRLSLYLKDLNMFVLRQIHSKINTTVVSMSMICLMLFLTICMLSSSLSLQNSFNHDLEKLTPMDLSIRQNKQDDQISITDYLTQNDFDMSKLTNKVTLPIYNDENFTLRDSIAPILDEMLQKFPAVKTDTLESIVPVSIYNQLAPLLHQQPIELSTNEYVILANYGNIVNFRNQVLELNTPLTINGYQLMPKFTKCIDGIVEISPQAINTGVFIVPDQVVQGLTLNEEILNANFNVKDSKEKNEISRQIETLPDTELSNLNIMTKIIAEEAIAGTSTIIVFVALYLGIIFLITSAALLALKELSESSDNVERYAILKKIGVSEAMMNRALFYQTGIFYLLPLALAMVHSVFGIEVGRQIIATFSAQDMGPSIALTAVLIVLIYGGYFIATYYQSKRIIKE